jgi:hypothetical protein
MQIFTYQVSYLPDLEMTEYHARYGDSPASKLFEMQDSFLHTVHTVARQYPLRCSLIYSFNPHEDDQDRKLQIFIRLVFEADLNPYTSRQVQKIFQASFWIDFYRIQESEPLSHLDLDWVGAISFGVKQEEKLSPTVRRDNSPSHYYLIQPFEPNESVDRVGFLSKLETYGNRAIVEIIFQPTTLTDSEQTGLENLIRVLSEQTSYDMTTSEISGKMRTKPIDPVAERTLQQFEELQEAIQSQLLYDVSIRVFAENHFNASLLLNEFWVESSQKPLYREINLVRELPLFEQSVIAFREGNLLSEAVWAEYWNSLAENSPLLALKRIHRLFTIEDLSVCFRVVVPDPVVVFSGIPKETDLKSSRTGKSILLGWQAGKSQNQAQVPLQSLNKHVFVCGVPGSGKTTAVLNLLFQLWTEHHIPFLVIEPAKTEYRSMLNCAYDEARLEAENDFDARALNQAFTQVRDVRGAIDSIKSDLRVYSLGNERVCPFRFNPFAFYKTITLDEHISTLEGCFKAAMPLFGPLPALLAEAIEQVYALHGWQPQDTAEYGVSLGRDFPNMQELYEAITAILETKHYSSDVASDIKTALEVRIGGLLRRSVGNMLNTRTSTPDIATLLDSPVVLEMDSLNEEQANLMTMFILATLREYARATRKSGSSLKHVVVIEEAHNIVGTDAAKGNQEEGASNPKAEATKYIVRMLAEMRALGQGIIIADQLPSAVSPEVIKNTNVKLAHRTVSGDDREILQQSMLLTKNQSEELARANPGDAYLFMEGIYKPVRIKEPNTKLIYGIEEPPSNDELIGLISHASFYQEAIATRDSMHQQKVTQWVQTIQQQMQELVTKFSISITAGNALLNTPIPAQVTLESLTVLSQDLKAFFQSVSDSPSLIEAKLQGLYVMARKEGVFDSVVDEPLVLLGKEALIQCQQDLIELSQRGEKKLEDLELQIEKMREELSLQASFDKINRYFTLYLEKINVLIDLLRQHEELDKVRASYQEALHFRNCFDEEAEYFDKIEISHRLDLATQINDILERLSSRIFEAEEQVRMIYQEYCKGSPLNE